MIEITESTDHMQYQEGMEVIDSDMLDTVLEETRRYNPSKYTQKNVRDALKKDVRARSAKGDDSERIDYIYVSRGTKVLNYRTISTPRPGTKRTASPKPG